MAWCLSSSFGDCQIQSRNIADFIQGQKQTS